ncbi:hypothetical protein [uncultured Kiloniella sp.]|uniref:hypothetical protein n=1 Tax=uncultured Kiloniella sp. TaxID=1133091 RepID=UPI0026276CB6|nr:hypothetical protein [uncultured Kiloniella sp.]
MRQYQPIPKKKKIEILSQLDKVKGRELCLLLLSLSELDDWRWAQEKYLEFINDEDEWVAKAAINGLGYIARISRNLDKDKVVKKLQGLVQIRPKMRSTVEDAINDIEMFLSRK